MQPFKDLHDEEQVIIHEDWDMAFYGRLLLRRSFYFSALIH